MKLRKSALVAAMSILPVTQAIAQDGDTVIFDAFESCLNWVQKPSGSAKFAGLPNTIIIDDSETSTMLSLSGSAYELTGNADAYYTHYNGTSGYRSECSLRPKESDTQNLHPILNIDEQLSRIVANLDKHGEFVKHPDPFGDLRDRPGFSSSSIYYLCDAKIGLSVSLSFPEPDMGFETWLVTVEYSNPKSFIATLDQCASS